MDIQEQKGKMIWKHVIIHSHKVNEIVSLSESSASHSN